MNINIQQDWPVYILLGAVFVFFVYVAIHSRMVEKQKKAGNEDSKSKK